MGETDNKQEWPELQKDDAELEKELFSLLESRVSRDPYSADGSYAKSLEALPAGLRAMAATHLLDVSLTHDSITWHFGNFGEPGLVAATEAGLTELGLSELAVCFHEAKELMMPLMSNQAEAPDDFDDFLAQNGALEQAEELNDRAWDLNGQKSDEKSLIYSAWVRYARMHPENVFEA
jgi:hypothetical protein